MKTIYIFLFAIISLSPVFSQVNLKNGLVACYPFNANAKDETGNGNNGTVNGATLTTDRFGKVNSAYDFNGTSDYIEISPDKLQNPTYTYSLWIKPSSNPQDGISYFLFSVGSIGGDQDVGLNNAYTNGGDGFTGGGYLTPTENSFCQSGTLPNINQWYHVVVVRESNFYKTYVNGILICTTTSITKPPFYGTGTVKAVIGGRQNYGQFAHCSLDDIHLYNRPLNAAEVKALYDGNPTQNTTITASNSAPCGGDKITFTANGASSTSKYQWKIDGVNAGTDSKTLSFNAPNISAQYQVKIAVEITDDDPCFPKKPATVEQTFTIKNCVIPPVSTGVDLKNGLVACYPFNGNTKDESGNNNNGTIRGGVTLTTDRFGKANSAYTFNGIDGFINVPDAPSLKFEQISIAMWIKATQFRDFVNSAGTWDRYGGPICRDTRPQGVWSGFTTTTSHGLLRFSVAMADKTASQTGVENSVDLNVWDFVVFMIDDGVEKIYRNGVLVLTESVNKGKKMHPNSEPIFIGRAFWLPSQVQLDAYFTGQIDDIHIYNRPLNDDEIKELFKESSPKSITISSSNPTLCGGDKITFTANGASATAKYQWKVDGVNAGTDSKTLTFNAPNISAQYQVKISVEVTDDDPCFPKKPATAEQTFTIKNCVIPPSTGVDLKNGLVACYPFNSNSKDETGNGNNGTVNGATLTTDRFGKANSAYNFNGSSFIALPDDKFAFTEYSYSVWIYVASNPTLGDAYRILSIGGNCGDQDINTGNTYFLGSYSGIGGGGYNISSPTTNSGVVTGSLPTIGQWYHGVITRDKNEIKLYVNGVLIRSVSTNGTLPYYGCDGKVFANIGTRSTQTQSFIGNIDDVHIYKRALNADEVKALYDGNNPQNITISVNKPTPCGGDKVTFTASGATNTSKYQWKIDGVNQGTNSKTFVYNSVNKSADYQAKITVEITDEDPCFPQKPVTVDKTINLKFCATPVANANNNILIPNIFTPNSDSINDKWEIQSLAGNSDVIVEIYNRWGELIFYSKGYSEPWDGTYKDKPVPEGTYAYVVRVGSDIILRGTVLVMR